VLLGSFHNAKNRAALVGHPKTARHQFRLKTSWNFGLRQGHG
jgi:hypothetical protein